MRRRSFALVVLIVFLCGCYPDFGVPTPRDPSCTRVEFYMKVASIDNSSYATEVGTWIGEAVPIQIGKFNNSPTQDQPAPTAAPSWAGSGFLLTDAFRVHWHGGGYDCEELLDWLRAHYATDFPFNYGSDWFPNQINSLHILLADNDVRASIYNDWWKAAPDTEKPWPAGGVRASSSVIKQDLYVICINGDIGDGGDVYGGGAINGSVILRSREIYNDTNNGRFDEDVMWEVYAPQPSYQDRFVSYVTFHEIMHVLGLTHTHCRSANSVPCVGKVITNATGWRFSDRRACDDCWGQVRSHMVYSVEGLTY